MVNRVCLFPLFYVLRLHGSHCDYQTQDGCTALSNAIKEGDTECTRLMLVAGAETEAADNVRHI